MTDTHKTYKLQIDGRDPMFVVANNKNRARRKAFKQNQKSKEPMKFNKFLRSVLSVTEMKA